MVPWWIFSKKKNSFSRDLFFSIDFQTFAEAFKKSQPIFSVCAANDEKTWLTLNSNQYTFLLIFAHFPFVKLLDTSFPILFWLTYTLFTVNVEKELNSMKSKKKSKSLIRKYADKNCMRFCCYKFENELNVIHFLKMRTL